MGREYLNALYPILKIRQMIIKVIESINTKRYSFTTLDTLQIYVLNLLVISQAF